jgi:hypothetical protein
MDQAAREVGYSSLEALRKAALTETKASDQYRAIKALSQLIERIKNPVDRAEAAKLLVPDFVKIDAAKEPAIRFELQRLYTALSESGRTEEGNLTTRFFTSLNKHETNPLHPEDLQTPEFTSDILKFFLTRQETLNTDAAKEWMINHEQTLAPLMNEILAGKIGSKEQRNELLTISAELPDILFAKIREQLAWTARTTIFANEKIVATISLIQKRALPFEEKELSGLAESLKWELDHMSSLRNYSSQDMRAPITSGDPKTVIMKALKGLATQNQPMGWNFRSSSANVHQVRAALCSRITEQLHYQTSSYQLRAMKRHLLTFGIH